MAKNLKDQILDAAVKLAERRGLGGLTRTMIAKAARVAPGSVSYHLGDMDDARNAIMAHAVVKENVRVVAHGLITNHPQALAAPEALRTLARESLQPA